MQVAIATYQIIGANMSNRVLAINPSRKVTVFDNPSAASRSLSGTGSRSRRHTISRRCQEGGGYVGGVWVQFTNFGEEEENE